MIKFAPARGRMLNCWESGARGGIYFGLYNMFVLGI